MKQQKMMYLIKLKKKNHKEVKNLLLDIIFWQVLTLMLDVIISHKYQRYYFQLGKPVVLSYLTWVNKTKIGKLDVFVLDIFSQRKTFGQCYIP